MTDQAEKVFREGFTELARSKPELGPIRMDDLARSRSRSSAGNRAPLTHWLALAAAIVVVAGLGLGLLFGGALRPGPRVIDAEPVGTTSPLVGIRWVATQIQGEPSSPACGISCRR